MNLHSIEEKELLLLPHQGVTPSTRHLRNTVDAADQDSEVRQNQYPTEHIHLPANGPIRLANLIVALLRRGIALSTPLPVSPQVGQNQHTARTHRSHLEGDAGYDEVVADVHNVDVVGGTSSRCDTSTDSLQDDGREITSDENPGVQSCFEETVLRPAVENEVLKRQVDGGSHEGRAQHQAADLHLERCLLPRIAMLHDATQVPEGLEKGPPAESKRVGPGFAPDADDRGGEEADGEEGEKEGIGSEFGVVAVGCGFYGAAGGHFVTCAVAGASAVAGGEDGGGEGQQREAEEGPGGGGS